jgi:hypothetical protein
MCVSNNGGFPGASSGEVGLVETVGDDAADAVLVVVPEHQELAAGRCQHPLKPFPAQAQLRHVAEHDDRVVLTDHPAPRPEQRVFHLPDTAVGPAIGPQSQSITEVEVTPKPDTGCGPPHAARRSAESTTR